MSLPSRVSVLVLAFVMVSGSFPSFAYAQSRSDWRDYWRRTSEGEVDEDIEREATSRRGVSSSVQRKINELDDDPVEEFPIPILLGVSLASIYSDFGDPRDGGDRSHQGQDILAPKGAYIVSPTEAVVTRTGRGSSAGNYVYTANPGGETFAYMHLDEIADGIRSGTELNPGDLIGYVGNTGNASGGPTHLHFEVREGRQATDPYDRLEGEFSLKDRMEAIDAILKDSDDEEEEATELLRLYRGLFVAAIAQDIDIPEAIEDLMGTTGTGAAAFTRDLTLGSQGADVIALQTLLIAKDAGPKADALAAAGATGYFGALTQAALAEYQTTNGIVPALGYFGPLTRASLAL